MKTAIGLDLYNQVTTGQKTMTLCASRSDHEHIPCVLVSAPSIAQRAEASASSETEVLPSEPVQSRQYYMTHRTGGDVRMDIKQQEPHPNGFRLQGSASNSRYYMTDKAGHMCRWKLLDKAMTLQASDYKDPPAILAPGR